MPLNQLPERHIVQPNETLRSIAEQYGITVEQIMEANLFHCDRPRLIFGQDIYLAPQPTMEPQHV